MSYWFPDDNNYLLTSVQYEVRFSIIGFLFVHPAERYQECARFVDVETELSKKIREAFQSSFFITNLDPIYDLLAAYFRFRTNPSGQLPLFDGGKTIQEIYSEDWLNFYYPEVRKISEDRVCAVNLIKSVVYHEEPSGWNAYQEVFDRLKGKYPMVRERKLLPDTLIKEQLEEEERKRFSRPTRFL